jgi:hypothetical protein
MNNVSVLETPKVVEYGTDKDHQRRLRELHKLEDVIFTETDNCLQSAMRVAEALSTIREKKLYKCIIPDSMDDLCFTTYVKRRFQFSKSRTYQLLELHEICQDIELNPETSTTGGLLTERSFRPLAPLAKDQRQKVWTEVNEEAGDDPIIPEMIKKTAKRLYPQDPHEEEQSHCPTREKVRKWIYKYLEKCAQNQREALCEMIEAEAVGIRLDAIAEARIISSLNEPLNLDMQD